MTGAGEEKPAEPRVSIPLGSLPALPPRLADLLRAATNPSATSHDLRDVVAASPGFAERVLQVLALTVPDPRRVTTIDDALREVGTRGVRGAVSALLLSPLFDVGAGHGVDPLRVAQHCLTTALWLGEVARVVRHRLSAAAYTAALMHDVGVLLLDRFAPAPYRELLARAEGEGRHHAELEQPLLGLTHARAGALLCAKWMLPPRITELVAAHHDIGERGLEPEAALLAIADLLAERHGASIFAWSPPRPLPASLLERVGLDQDGLAALGGLAASIQEQAVAIRRVVSRPA